MKIRVITAFPEMIKPYFSESMFKKACEQDLIDFSVWDLRDFTRDKHRQIDDAQYGGGAGMVLKPEPFFRAYDQILEQSRTEEPNIILPTPQGKKLNHDYSVELSQLDEINFFCGHYKGIDERVREYLVTHEISIGDYVLTGGELPALVIIDSLIRHIPQVLHDYQSAQGDSFTDHLLEGPVYTRPREYRGHKVPDILLSGHHKNIEEWREKKRINRTKERREELLKNKSENHLAED
ncbi:MAG: tRNA (guanosine(37)-N1)-methyltransferase TrmD [Candidatus Marinimicrobia bacterium]|nr:tRNA (guanosine(37)-N1)-methyltransferase TrmD [Candidatus Neomarinimicrobiota bacterium]